MEKRTKTAGRKANNGPITVPERTPRRFYGHGLPNVDLSRLAGRLIVVEGADGSGRSTQIAMLTRWLEGSAFPGFDYKSVLQPARDRVRPPATNRPPARVSARPPQKPALKPPGRP